MVEFGVFLPGLNNGWIVPTAAPQYQPSYAIEFIPLYGMMRPCYYDAPLL